MIFLKGCPLNCEWCCNPEGLAPHPEIMYRATKCRGDYACIERCPDKAILASNSNEGITLDRARCDECENHECVDACCYDALNLSGSYFTVDELMKRIQRDRQYWGSEGGVTLSGGEPMYQPEFAVSLLKKCCESYIHTSIETCGSVPWEYYEDALDYLDWIFFDIKHMNPEAHETATGVSNKLILRNAEKIAGSDECRMVIRMPIIPGFNDSNENIKATAEFVRMIGKREVNILPMHHLGKDKYTLLGMEYECGSVDAPSLRRMKDIQRVFESYSLQCSIGSDTEF